MTSKMLRTTVGAAVLSVALAAPAFAAGLAAHVNSGTVAEGDAFQLTLTANGQVSAAPDLAPLRKDFDILGTSQSSSTQIINGQTSQSVSWIVSLSPKSKGALEIPSIRAGSLSSAPVDITVIDAGAMPKATGASGIAVTAKLDDGNPFLFQETPLTVRIETSGPIQSAELIAPQSSAYEILQRGEDRMSQAMRNGQTVNVIERTYMLKPQEEGAIEIPPFVLRGTVEDPDAQARDPFAGFGFSGFSGFGASMFKDMFDTGKPFSVRSDPIKLTVRADPNAGSGPQHWFLPAKDVRLSAEWTPAHPAFKEGEAARRRVSLLALGASAVQLPDLTFENTDGARIYLDDVQTGEDQTTEGTVARKDFLLSVVPTRGGEIMLPDIKVNWTDSVSGEAKTVTLPGEVITAEGTLPPVSQPAAAAPEAAPAAPIAQQTQLEVSETLPVYLLAGLGAVAVLAALGAAALYVGRKRRPGKMPRKSMAAQQRKQDGPDILGERRRQLAHASAKEKSGDLRGCYGCVLAWRRLAGGDSVMTDAARQAIAGLEKAAFAPAAEAAEGQAREWVNILAREDRKIGPTQSHVPSRLPSLYPA